jgi:YVTN family beta-propeller protein
MAPPQIPGYRDLHVIGRGGFAEVFAAVQPAFGDRLVAVKVLMVDALEEGTQQRFERECHAAGRISWHPNVVNVYDSGITEDGRPYLVMEHMSRGSLADLVAQGAVSWHEATALAVPLAGALEAAHRAGTLHRDVKPQNVMLGHLDEPKLSDFGIARVEGSTASSSRTMRATLAHAPPEALDGKSSVAGDVYSLASTTYELVAGKPAFVEPDDETITPIIARLAGAPVPDLRPLGIPDQVASVLEQAMAKDPAERPPTAQAFGEALQHALGELGQPPVRMVVSSDRAHTSGAAAGAATPPTSPPSTAPPGDPEPPAVAAAVTPPPVAPIPTPAEPAPTPAEADPSPAFDPYGTRDLDGSDPLGADTSASVHLGRADGAAHPDAAAPPADAAGRHPAPPGAPRAKRSRRPLLLVLGVVTVLAFAGGAAVVLLGRDDDGGAADEGATVVPPDESTSTAGAAALASAEEVAVASIDVGSAPLGVAVSDGLVYVADLQDDTVTVLEDGSGQVLAALPVDGRPRRVTPAEDDGVWVTLASTNEVGKVNRDGEGQRLPVGADPIGVAEGFGSVWVVNAADGSLSRISTDTQELEATIEEVAGDPRQVTTGGEAVWVSDHDADEVVRIDPETNQVTDRIPVEAEPIGMGFGDGSVWVTASGDDAVSRIDPESLEVLSTTAVGQTPVAVAVAGGAAWVTNQNADTVSRLDVATGEVTATVDVGAQPGGVAIGGDSVWVTNMGGGTLSRLTAG